MTGLVGGLRELNRDLSEIISMGSSQHNLAVVQVL